MRKIALLFFSLSTLLLASTLELSTPLSSLQGFEYETQHEKEITIPDDVKTIIISYEKDSSAMINKFLDSKEKDFLEKNHAVFIADISKMPSLITSLFALPKMQKYKHTIYLHYSDEFAKFIPAVEEKVTILKIQNSKVSNISYITTVKELQEALQE
ncbi:hypothetical protein [Sulfurimonas sp.]|uniref:hypothetical protein n=1 Tax=Sulfurimonas sp. TaxID=2022749 RepID=UPI003D0AFA59